MAKQVVASEYWRHQATGTVWAVTLVNGHVIGAYGPLSDSDASRELLRHLAYSERQAEWVNRDVGAFVPESRYGRLP